MFGAVTRAVHSASRRCLLAYATMPCLRPRRGCRALGRTRLELRWLRLARLWRAAVAARIRPRTLAGTVPARRQVPAASRPVAAAAKRVARAPVVRRRAALPEPETTLAVVVGPCLTAACGPASAVRSSPEDSRDQLTQSWRTAHLAQTLASLEQVPSAPEVPVACSGCGITGPRCQRRPGVVLAVMIGNESYSCRWSPGLRDWLFVG